MFNFNTIKRTYNTNFHLIVSSKAAAELIIKEWLEQCTPTFALRRAQHMRRVEDKVKNLIEMAKYGSKVFADPTMEKNTKCKVLPYIFDSAFHNIIGAMSGHRLFDRFGFNLPPRPKKGNVSVLTQYEKLVIVPEVFG